MLCFAKAPVNAVSKQSRQLHRATQAAVALLSSSDAQLHEQALALLGDIAAIASQHQNVQQILASDAERVKLSLGALPLGQPDEEATKAAILRQIAG